MLQTFEPAHQTPPLFSSTSSLPVKTNGNMSPAAHHHILIVTGPAGCGKSTVAKYLAEQHEDFAYIEGDDFHPKANIDKMASGIPLNDADRWDWLILLRDRALLALREGAKGVVVTCSALKKKYRDVIRTAPLYDAEPKATVHFIYLDATEEILLARVGARQGHYMKDTMVLSQLKSLEKPDDMEKNIIKDVLCIDVSGSIKNVLELAAAEVDKVLAKDAAVL